MFIKYAYIVQIHIALYWTRFGQGFFFFYIKHKTSSRQAYINIDMPGKKQLQTKKVKQKHLHHTCSEK